MGSEQPPEPPAKDPSEEVAGSSPRLEIMGEPFVGEKTSQRRKAGLAGFVIRLIPKRGHEPKDEDHGA